MTSGTGPRPSVHNPAGLQRRGIQIDGRGFGPIDPDLRIATIGLPRGNPRHVPTCEAESCLRASYARMSDRATIERTAGVLCPAAAVRDSGIGVLVIIESEARTVLPTAPQALAIHRGHTEAVSVAGREPAVDGGGRQCRQGNVLVCPPVRTLLQAIARYAIGVCG